MKVELNRTTKDVVRVVQEEVKEVVLRLTEKEAQHLLTVVGNITNGNSSNPDSIRCTTSTIFRELVRLGFATNLAGVQRTMNLGDGA